MFKKNKLDWIDSGTKVGNYTHTHPNIKIERSWKPVWSDAGSSQPEAELSHTQLTVRGKTRWLGTKSHHVEQKLHVNPFLCSCLADSLSLWPISRCTEHTQSLPQMWVCECVCVCVSPWQLRRDGCVPMVQAGCGVPGGPHDSYWCSGVRLL